MKLAHVILTVGNVLSRKIHQSHRFFIEQYFTFYIVIGLTMCSNLSKPPKGHTTVTPLYLQCPVHPHFARFSIVSFVIYL